MQRIETEDTLLSHESILTLSARCNIGLGGGIDRETHNNNLGS